VSVKVASFEIEDGLVNQKSDEPVPGVELAVTPDLRR
jgi:hypothetical protein